MTGARKKPVKSDKVSFHIRLNPDTAEKLSELAEREHRSVTSQVEHYIERAIEAA